MWNEILREIEALYHAREDHSILRVPRVQPPFCPAATEVGGRRMQSPGGQQ
ncbi:MAG: hypothetical protein LUQ22_04055 [Methanotrichaceae archaeon]|nr:hypothetical protein [Methanotrichaceae archaeon]